MKLRFKLLVVFSLVLGIALVSVSYLGYSNAKSQLVTGIETQMFSVAEGKAQELDGWLVSKAKVVETVANTVQDVVADQPIPVSFLHCYKKDPAFSDLYIGFTDGSFLDGSGWVPPPEFDPRQRIWYKKATAEQGTIFSDPYLDAVTGKFAVSVAVPLPTPAGEARGVVAADILLETLTEKVKNINLSGKGYGFLLDTNGVAVAHPDEGLVSTDLSQNEVTKDLAVQLAAKDKGILEYEWAGTQLVVFRQLPSTGWVLGIVVPKDVAYQDLAALQTLRLKFISVNLAALAVAALLTLVLAGRVTRPIQELAVSAEQIATGDLTVKVSVAGKDEVADVALAFNKMVENLRSLVIKIHNSSDLVGAASREMGLSTAEAGKTADQIAGTVGELARGAEEQAGLVQKSAQMVDGMTRATAEITSGITAFSTMAAEVQTAVQKGSDAVTEQIMIMEHNKKENRAVSGCIEALADKSSRIGQIVEVIRGIAGQTNLLALNAAIEAARAGEQGRGFAVVADEVKKLAEQAEQSSQEIAVLIRETQLNTEQAVKEMAAAEASFANQETAVVSTKAFFEHIKGSVNQVADQTRQVSQEVQQVNASAMTVLEAITNIKDISGESATYAGRVAEATREQTAATEQVSRQVENLAAESERLLQEIRQFRT
ncbi:MAG: methyl-accepting chemotaxis protein [Heliobacteriaceae bacterium]|nr:methyl-accepting chemotaxis protein [Heliobacteriaceae bacterium]MDD4587410.1 methyl-accepting chemotaxis protein [Heliobacteriaceae bacterium]